MYLELTLYLLKIILLAKLPSLLSRKNIIPLAPGCERKLEISESCVASRLSCSGDEFVSIEHGGFIGLTEGRKRERKRPARQRGPVGYNTQAYNGISIGRDDMQLLSLPRARLRYNIDSLSPFIWCTPCSFVCTATRVYIICGRKSFQNTLLQQQVWLSHGAATRADLLWIIWMQFCPSSTLHFWFSAPAPSWLRFDTINPLEAPAQQPTGNLTVSMQRKSRNDSAALENFGRSKRPVCQDKIEGVQAGLQEWWLVAKILDLKSS